MKTYIKELDGLRGLSVLFVIFFHAFLNNFGWVGVQIFFVLSGYLIGGILLELKENDKTLSQNLKTFWIRRSLRIFPVYYLYLLFFILLFVLFHIPSELPQSIWYLVTYTFNFTRPFPDWKFSYFSGHLWSLSVEEQFYLFYPLCILLLKEKGIKIMLIFFIIACPLFRFLYADELIMRGKSVLDARVSVYWNIFSQIDAFCMGTVIHVFKLYKLPFKLISVIFTGVLALSLALILMNGGFDIVKMTNLQHVWGNSVLNVLFICLILFITNERKTFINNFFTLKWIVEIGKVSYGMYLFHMIFLVGYFYIIKKFNPNLAGKYLVCGTIIFFLFLFCKVVFKYVESRFLQLKPPYEPKVRRPAIKVALQ